MSTSQDHAAATPVDPSPSEPQQEAQAIAESANPSHVSPMADAPVSISAPAVADGAQKESNMESAAPAVVAGASQEQVTSIPAPAESTSKPQPSSDGGLGAADEPALAPSTTTAGSVLSINLLLTTGARHPYKIDEKYLSNRKVAALDKQGQFDPRELSGYQLKELIWIDWRAEWEPRPANPSYIRLILLGRLIEDKSTLRDYPFNLATVNVVHMTVKPADILDDDDAAPKGGKHGRLRARDDGEGGAGCRCVIL